MAKNIHKEPFDDGTVLKLKIFDDYLKEWLPVFIAKKEPIWKTINVFDFFAGPGKDAEGKVGSPLMIINQLKTAQYNGIPFRNLIQKNNLKVNLFFNEFAKSKYDELVTNLQNHHEPGLFDIHHENKDFKYVFEGNKKRISGNDSANLLFLDQNGIKQIDHDVFGFIVAQKKTDFIFYISSSFINRFTEHESFKRYLSLERIAFEGKSYHHCHKVVLEYYRSLVPRGKEYYLAPFSIKKGSNIYGLIFGTQHPFGIEKFLKVCWKHDKLTGEANFDIDEDKIDSFAPYLFAEFNKPKKVSSFEAELAEKIERKVLETNKAAYLYGLSNGFLPKHVNLIFGNLVKKGILSKLPQTISTKVHKLEPERFTFK